MQGLLRDIDQVVSRITGFDQVTALAVVAFIILGFTHQAIHLILGEVGGSRDLDALLFVRRLILGHDVQNTIGINIKGDFNLRHTARGRGNAIQAEVAQCLIVTRHGAFALQHMNVHGRLTVGRRAKDFRLLGRDRGVAWDQGCHHATQGLQTQAQRCHVEQQQVADFTTQDTTLNRRADGNDFVRVHTFMRLFAGQAAH